MILRCICLSTLDNYCIPDVNNCSLHKYPSFVISHFVLSPFSHPEHQPTQLMLSSTLQISFSSRIIGENWFHFKAVFAQLLSLLRKYFHLRGSFPFNSRHAENRLLSLLSLPSHTFSKSCSSFNRVGKLNCINRACDQVWAYDQHNVLSPIVSQLGNAVDGDITHN